MVINGNMQNNFLSKILSRKVSSLKDRKMKNRYENKCILKVY